MVQLRRKKSPLGPHKPFRFEVHILSLTTKMACELIAVLARHFYVN